MKKYLDQDYTLRVTQIKIFADRYAPKKLKPFLDYALGWLAPELLGSGVSIKQVDDLILKAEIPHKNSNCDFQKEIHHGLVLNTSLEMARLMLLRHAGADVAIGQTEVALSKKSKWDQNLILELATEPEIWDDFFIRLQNPGEVLSVSFDFIVRDARSSEKRLLSGDSIQLKLQLKGPKQIVREV